ncbi:GntR family transcriptional regulator [Actinoplanes sp. TRM 88003]|uniref:GntR family transcriptional regulator n=1 Tax=Paractinoplanes aksuensis TaxID=2939490 RepID=A0ABT1DW96_9ACTN|nr:GntR family transcriptional regulator [Actinoplanes aksuensis]MCO8275119.1 GntR family transcriptional regulator [Actinoplanes aksuensis]
MAISKRAEPSLLTDQVYSALHEAVMNGDLPAGSRLRIRDLAAQVGTSVMPLASAASSSPPPTSPACRTNSS